jgi:protein-S-isoprenylcysteine O-methyltransferase Ste14
VNSDARGVVDDEPLPPEYEALLLPSWRHEGIIASRIAAEKERQARRRMAVACVVYVLAGAVGLLTGMSLMHAFTVVDVAVTAIVLLIAFAVWAWRSARRRLAARRRWYERETV